MSVDYEVVVVGAGPAGASAALELARAGVGPVLLVDKTTMPRVKPCAGGLSPNALGMLEELGVREGVAARAYGLDSLRLVGPSGRVAMVRTALPAWVLARSVFDELLVEAAKGAGVTVRSGVPVEQLVERRGRVTAVRCGGEELTCRWVVVASGATSTFRWDPRPSLVLDTCMAWFEDLPFPPHRLEMIFDAELAPQYGWLFPESDGRANVGLCLARDRRRGRSIRDVFGAFLDRHFGARLAGARQLGGWRGHPISATRRVEHHAPPGVLVAGEAGRLTNIATGEGISYAIRSGQLAARAISRASSSESSRAVAGRYERWLRRAMGRELLVGGLFLPVGRIALDGLTRFAQLPLATRLTKGAVGAG